MAHQRRVLDLVLDEVFGHFAATVGADEVRHLNWLDFKLDAPTGSPSSQT